MGADANRDVNGSADERERIDRLSQSIEGLPGVFYSYEVRPNEPRTLTYLGPGLDALIGPESAAKFKARVEYMFEIVHPDDLGRMKKRARQGLETGETVDLDVRLRCDSGEYVWARSICSGNAARSPGSPSGPAVGWRVP